MLARMILPVHAINYICSFFVNQNAKTVAFVVYWNAVRNAEIRPYAVRELKLRQYARGRGFALINFVLPLKDCKLNSDLFITRHLLY